MSTQNKSKVSSHKLSSDILFVSSVTILICMLRELPAIALHTVKFLNIGTPEIFAVIYLKLKQRGQTVRVFCQNGANGIANSEDTDQTAPRSSLIWVCTICPDLSVRKLKVITVFRIYTVYSN